MHRWASATGFVLAQGTHQAEEQRENQFKQCSDGEQTCKSTSCLGITPSECSLSKEQSCRDPKVDLQVCSPSLHCLNWFSRCSSAWWVPWARTKPVADAHLCIPVVLWSWTCLLIDVVFPFPLIRYGSPPGGAISLVPLWFPWWFLYNLLAVHKFFLSAEGGVRSFYKDDCWALSSLQWCRSLLSIGGDNLQFYPNFALFSTLRGINLDHDFVQVWKFSEDQKKMQMEHFFSPNSGEDQKKKRSSSK